MAPVDIGGLRSACSAPVGAESGMLLVVFVAVMLAPLADAILPEPERRCSTRRGRSATCPGHRRSGWRPPEIAVILRRTGSHASVDPFPAGRPAAAPVRRHP